jgi:hypothetical protein
MKASKIKIKKILYINIGITLLLLFSIFICYKTYQAQYGKFREGMSPEDRKQAREENEAKAKTFSDCKTKCKDIKDSKEKKTCNDTCKTTCTSPCFNISDCGDVKTDCDGLEEGPDLNECKKAINDCKESSKTCCGACGGCKGSKSDDGGGPGM